MTALDDGGCGDMWRLLAPGALRPACWKAAHDGLDESTVELSGYLRSGPTRTFYVAAAAASTMLT